MPEKTLKHLLETEHEFTQVVIDAMPVPVFIKDCQGVYLGCNRAFEEFIGMSREQMTGHSVYDLYPVEEADVFYSKDKELLDNPGIQEYETDISRITGQDSIVRFHKATYLDRTGNVAGLVGTIFDITHQKKLERRLKHRASHDYLTGLLNRRAALQRLTKNLEVSLSTGQPLSVLMVDIDHFKQLNDTQGHKAGDEALIRLADYLQHYRVNGNTVARFGGEEFLLALPDTDVDTTITIAEDIRQHVEDTSWDEGWSMRLSIGVSTSNDGLVDPDALIHQADEALYRAKASGRNRVCHSADD